MKQLGKMRSPSTRQAAPPSSRSVSDVLFNSGGPHTSYVNKSRAAWQLWGDRSMPSAVHQVGPCIFCSAPHGDVDRRAGTVQPRIRSRANWDKDF